MTTVIFVKIKFGINIDSLNPSCSLILVEHDALLYFAL